MDDLAEDLGCVRRTVYRDLDALMFAGFPVVSEKRDGRVLYRFLETFKIGDTPFTADEVLAPVTEACLAAVEGADALNAFVHPTPEIARAQAEAADARLKAGDAPAMCGIPLGIKDLFCTKGVPSQAASARSAGRGMGGRRPTRSRRARARRGGPG